MVVHRLALFCFLLSPLVGQLVLTHEEVTILAIRVSFPEDESVTTTGNGSFLGELTTNLCVDHIIDPPPHDRLYFEAQIKAADSYFRSVSKGRFGINLENSTVMPQGNESSYIMNSTMETYHPYGDEVLQDKRLAELFQESLEMAYAADSMNFDNYDVVVIFHAGIGQDFSLPFLDPTPNDIPSAYIDSDFLLENLGVNRITFDNGSSVSSGIILPETQNHLLYEIAADIFFGVLEPCDYQFGLTGTFTLMMGFAIGLPPLWIVEEGMTGVGVFALMDQGSNNGRGIIPAPPDAWTRIYAGWEMPTVVTPANSVEIASRDSVENQIVEIDINGSEYFLIECRNNWIFEGVDIDSLRWKNRDSENVMPPYVRILMDSVAVKIDSITGVITSVPNYDLGLPGSGLLIWHIDESKIYQGLHNYSVNKDREHRGIDLEEADGAQDIGYPSIFIFTDPTLGFWSDMWFDGNSQYEFANPAFVNQSPSFGPDTYPNTKANNGSDSYVEINNISGAGKTMTFSVENSLMADGFPDSLLYIHFLYDFSGDGTQEVIGGEDSLWWSGTDLSKRKFFFEIPSDSFQLAVTNYETNEPKFVVVTDVGDSLLLSVFRYQNDGSGFSLDWKIIVDTFYPYLPYLSIGYPDSDKVNLSWGDTQTIVTKDGVESHLFIDMYFDPRDSLEAQIEDPIEGYIQTVNASIGISSPLTITRDDQITRSLEGYTFETITSVDLDLDGRIEILTTDDLGSVYVINTELMFESGFPVDIGASSSILARDLFGDEHPELVTQVRSGDIVILDWKGNERNRLTNSKGSELRMLSGYQGRNCIVTESAIWLFDSTSTVSGNEWPYVHHDLSNRRTLIATLEVRKPNEDRLIDVNRTYNYPNPVKEGSTTIRVFVESAEKVEIMIYDIAGYFIEKLSLEIQAQGEINEIVWDVRNIESGVYFANIEATRGNKTENKILKISVVH